MLSTSLILVVLSLAAGANAGVCGNNWAQFRSRSECESIGCKYSNNNCRQPDACIASGTVTYMGRATGLSAERKPISPETARLCDVDADCTAKYVVQLHRQWTTGPPNCNDKAMLPPHGVNQSECPQDETSIYNGVRLMDYTGHPYKNDGIKQSVAAAQNAVTALTEETQSCFSNDLNASDNCAFPLGYFSDTIQKGKKVCIKVRNAEDRWIEIMAASKSGSDASFCVKDRNKDELTDGDKGCAKAGALVDIRESGQSPGTDEMEIEFYTEDNFDDANIDFHWRIAASEVQTVDDTPGREETRDGEDWAQYRDGADYPMSLMKPYPEGYEGDAIFETEGESSALTSSPVLFLVLVASFIASLF